MGKSEEKEEKKGSMRLYTDRIAYVPIGYTNVDCECRSSVDPTLTCNIISKLRISDPKAVVSDLSLDDVGTSAGDSNHTSTHSRGQPSLGHLPFSFSYKTNIL